MMMNSKYSVNGTSIKLKDEKGCSALDLYEPQSLVKKSPH